MLSERTIEVQINRYLCFLNCTKAFDKVQHKEVFEMKGKRGLHREDI